MIKNAHDAGADERTPSIPQYFSWINNTNEGSTETQTLINLDFFKYMKDTYGMEIKIYAWDAGNFDGASEGYGNLNSEKFKWQYPEGYKNVVAKAKEMGIQMGLWGSPDGYGDDEETQKERFEFFVHLCRDYNFGEFKLDGVCGKLRPEKGELFAKMLEECRKYSPNLIVLNHRLDLYEAEKNVTTFLWNGQETYVDILIRNKCTAMHNRAYMFTRGHVEGLQRLAEDHGVCISSGIDYFEDELIYQAFNRSLILAPEMYGNPWFMRDDELPKLARVYNLHARNASLLVDGMLLGEDKGSEACARGSKTKRFISTGNNSWETKNITLELNESIGISDCGKFAVNMHHPYEKHIGIFAYGDEIKLELMPFRAALIEISALNEAEPMLTNCEYEIIKEEKDGTPVEVKILKADEQDIFLLKNGEYTFFSTSKQIDIKEKAPVFIGELNETEENPENGEELYETAMFAITNDALEKRSILRSGKSEIAQVNACREAFFNQKTYRLRGCEAEKMFDGKEDTFFDYQSRTYGGGSRIKGGCLRVDFGEQTVVDSVEITYFSSNEETKEVLLQKAPEIAEYSSDLRLWKNSKSVKEEIIQNNRTEEIIKFRVHTYYTVKGKLVKAVYNINDGLRYLRIKEPVDRIYSVKLIKDGKEIKASKPFANNLQAHYSLAATKAVKSGEFILPDDFKKESRLAIAINGNYDDESVYCTIETGDGLCGCPSRAPDYKANVWEHVVTETDGNYTYFFPLKDEYKGKKIKINAIFSTGQYKATDCRVYLFEKH